MTNSSDFEPRWASVPGRTILEVLQRREQSTSDLRAALQLSNHDCDALLEGRSAITTEMAEALSLFLGASSSFWLKRDSQYREDLRRLAQDEWARSLPVSELVRRGWMKRPENWKDQIVSCCEFFELDGPEAWAARYAGIKGAGTLRTSQTFDGTIQAISSWLRRCEIDASGVAISAWDAEGLRALLPSVKALSKHRQPAASLEQLRELLAGVGVVLVLVRPPVGAPVSGAAWRDRNGRRLLALTARHLSDDHLWFTVMHEIAHLLLHGNEQTFVDQIDDAVSDSTDQRETEANAFAADALLPEAVRRDLHGQRITRHTILSLAVQHGVAPGVVVGLLQHDEVLGYHQMNGFKRRYAWHGDVLTTK